MGNVFSGFGGVLNPVKNGQSMLRQCTGLLWLLVILVLPGCATFSVSVNQMEKNAANRDLDGAIKALDQLKLSGGDETLKHLNKGTLLRLKGDYEDSNKEFETAKTLIDRFDAISVKEQFASVAVNDTMKAYEGLPSEQLMVYAFEAMNYLQSKNEYDAAVEARQFDVKQQLVAEKNNSKYLSGAFVRYLNSMIYEAIGEKDEARIEMEKAVDAYKAQDSGFPVPKGLLDDLERRKKDQPPASEVIFVLHNGLGPTLSEAIVRVANPNPDSGPFMFSLAVPKFVKRPAPVSRVVLSSGDASATSEIVEDVNDIAERSLNDRLPLIIARGVARMVAKSVAVNEAKKRGGTLAALFTNIVTVVTERADTRSWSLLPGNILMTRLKLPPGKHDITATYYSPGGNVLGVHEFKNVEMSNWHRVFLSDYFMEPLVLTDKR